MDVEKQIYDINDSVSQFEKVIYARHMADLSAITKVFYTYMRMGHASPF